jgi:ABC-type Fe3+-hydroxamate transport system substrate-binding protein
MKPMRQMLLRTTGLAGFSMGVVLGSLLFLGCARSSGQRSAEPQRIIAVAPNIVEILFELDLGDRVVAVGDHCEWPQGAAEKPKIGGLLDPRLETIVALEPDLAILLPSEQALATALERLGIEVLVTPVETLADVERAIAVIAGRVNIEGLGSEVIGRLRRDLLPQRLANDLPVFMVVGREPGNLSDVYAAGGGTFLDELLVRLGGVNVVGDSPLRYPQVGLEEISMRRPGAIIELQPAVLSDAARAGLVADWRRELPGSEPCIAVIEGNHVLVPGPRVGKLYRDLADALSECG